jgi:hydrogenase nickel incorporation protein HypA/HybF
MHELALMEQVRAIALEEAATHGASRIHRLRLRIGRWSGVEPEALRFAFEVVMRCGAGEGASLDLEVVPAVCFCPDCEQEFEPDDVIFACPRCGVLSRRILRGRELELAGLEVS